MYVKQISVFVENKFGRMAEILNALAEKSIDISALSLADTSEFGILRLIVDKPELAVEVLKEELSAGHGVDVAIDCLGGDFMGKCIHYLTHGARWIMIAALAGTKTEIDLKNIYVRNVRIIGSTLRSRTPDMKAFILSELVKNVYPKIEAGQVMPTIYKVLPITEAESAHDILYKGENVGKVVLTVKE